MHWKSAADGLITFDSTTRLRWLDLTESQLYDPDAGGSQGSYDLVSSELGPGGLFDGFRFATIDEVNSLFSNAGLPTVPAGFPSQPDDNPLGNIAGETSSNLTTAFIQLLGQTDCLAPCSGAAGSFGLIGDPLASSGNVYVAGAWHYEGPDPARDLLAYGATSQHSAGGFGSFLVSDRPTGVPEPSTLSLFGASLLGFWFTRRWSSVTDGP
jgi:hypothetical protein